MSDTPMDATPRTLDVALADIRSWRARYESMERALRAELSEARTDAYRYRAERDAMQAVERYDAAEAAERIIGEWVQLECSVHLNSADVDFLRLRLTAALTAAAERERVLREACEKIRDGAGMYSWLEAERGKGAAMTEINWASSVAAAALEATK